MLLFYRQMEIYISLVSAPVVPCDVLHAALAEGGVVRIVNKLRRNMSKVVQITPRRMARLS